MYLEKEYFDSWMQRIVVRLEQIEKVLAQPPPREPQIFPEGDKLLDNFDLCQMLNVSKRTLRRYRATGDLPFQMIYHKTYYKESDVMRFIEKNFSSFRKMKKEKNLK